MKKYGVTVDGEVQDETFDTYKEALDFACYLMGCCEVGKETLNMSNPGDYPMDSFEDPEIEVVEL